MKRFAIYGKGGSGKSTIVSNLSVQMARKSYRTLQIGCDPKHDSTRSLMDGKRVVTVMDVVQNIDELKPGAVSASDFLFTGLQDIGCIEAGGPESGIGCAGLGISTAFRLIQDCGVFDNYDVVLMDVLGDVVCGGFAAPMMKGLAGCIAIVVAESPMSMYAANNIAKAVRRYERNGCFLAGLIANNVRNSERVQEIEAFASRLSTGVLAVIPHDEQIFEAERKRLPVSVFGEGETLDSTFEQLSDRLLAAEASVFETPTPMTDESIEDFFSEFAR